MLRRLFTFFSLVSLVLCVATCVLWVRSYWVADDVAIYHGHGASHGYGGNSSTGMAYLWRYAGQPQYSMMPPPWKFTTYEPVDMGRYRMPGPDICRRLGPFAWGGRRMGSDWVDEGLFPLWPVASAAALLPAIWIAQRTRSGNHRIAGRCPACGYDLRASSERCPECGKAVARVAGRV